jgi:hypothetical protein
VVSPRAIRGPGHRQAYRDLAVVGPILSRMVQIRPGTLFGGF